MRRPHVYERSAPRTGRGNNHEPIRCSLAARYIAMQLGTMIDRAQEAGLLVLAELLESARVEAEKEATSEQQAPSMPEMPD